MRIAVVLMFGLLASNASLPVASADPWLDCVMGGGTVVVPGWRGSEILQCCPKDAGPGCRDWESVRDLLGELLV